MHGTTIVGLKPKTGLLLEKDPTKHQFRCLNSHENWNSKILKNWKKIYGEYFPQSPKPMVCQNWNSGFALTNTWKYEIFAESAFLVIIFFNLKSRLIKWNDPFGNLRTSKISYFSGWSFLYRKRHIWSTFYVISRKLRLQFFFVSSFLHLVYVIEQSKREDGYFMWILILFLYRGEGIKVQNLAEH